LEIERKRKATSAVFGGRKFMKVSDLDSARQQQQQGAVQQGGGADAEAEGLEQARAASRGVA